MWICGRVARDEALFLSLARSSSPSSCSIESLSKMGMSPAFVLNVHVLLRKLSFKKFEPL